MFARTAWPNTWKWRQRVRKSLILIWRAKLQRKQSFTYDFRLYQRVFRFRITVLIFYPTRWKTGGRAVLKGSDHERLKKIYERMKLKSWTAEQKFRRVNSAGKVIISNSSRWMAERQTDFMGVNGIEIIVLLVLPFIWIEQGFDFKAREW